MVIFRLLKRSGGYGIGILFCGLLFAPLTDAFAQVKGKVRGGLDVEYYLSNNQSSQAYMFDINLGYNLQNNMNVGIRLGNITGARITYDKYQSTNFSFAGTYSYYFAQTNPFSPFVGCGLGLHVLRHKGIMDDIVYGVPKTIGGFMTAGFELWKFKLAVEYHLIPTSKVPLLDFNSNTPPSLNDKINIKNSYIGITAGLYIGGGNWKKAAAISEREKVEQAERVKKETFSYFAQNYVEQEMNKWLQKGEFERTDDWQQRINDDNRKSKEAELRKNVEQAYIAERSREIPIGNITLGTYYADKEVFLIKNDIHGDWLHLVSVHEAPDFKNNWHNLVKTPQWVIRNDQITFAGYKFEPIEIVANNNTTEQPKDSPTKTEVVVNIPNTSIDKGLPFRQGDFAIGCNLVWGTGGNYRVFGIGGKISYNVTDPVRLTGEFTYFLPDKVKENVLGIIVDMKLMMWDVSVNGHYLFSVADRIAIYPSVGLGMFGCKTKVDVDAGIFGSQSGGESDKWFAYSFGGGIDFSLSSNFVLNGELKHKRFGGDLFDGYRTNFSVGLAYKF